eukprot:scaffold60718_cov59-Attheya_sp.AAC.3
MLRSYSYSRRFLLLRRPGLARRSAAATAAAFLLFASHELIASFVPTSTFQQYSQQTRGRHSTRCHALNDKDCTNEERVRVEDSIVEKLQVYHATHHNIPLPAVSHVRLTEQDLNPSGRNILVIGDVHACIEELQVLHDSAMQSNGGRPFRCVILAGDLVNKGPQSAAVLTEVRQQPYWYAVRGNNDDAAIAAILSNNEAKLKKYKWDKAQQVRLTSQDIVWWSELPYTITIPRYIFEMDADKTNSDKLVDTVIVHGGLCPDVLLEKQTIKTMVTTRNLIQIDMSPSFFAKTEGKGADRYKKEKVFIPHDNNRIPRDMSVKDLKDFLVDRRPDMIASEELLQVIYNSSTLIPWAQEWRGPPMVIFGHDARRGLQLHDWAIGLDTGACYGKELTGIILPHRKLVNVPSKQQSPKKSKIQNLS